MFVFFFSAKRSHRASIGHMEQINHKIRIIKCSEIHMKLFPVSYTRMHMNGVNRMKSVVWLALKIMTFSPNTAQ